MNAQTTAIGAGRDLREIVWLHKEEQDGRIEAAPRGAFGAGNPPESSRRAPVLDHGRLLLQRDDGL